jgi:hypothetical protein
MLTWNTVFASYPVPEHPLTKVSLIAIGRNFLICGMYLYGWQSSRCLVFVSDGSVIDTRNPTEDRFF